MILQNRAITVSENDGLPLPKRYWAILATALGVGMSVIDGTIANVALPTIARDLEMCIRDRYRFTCGIFFLIIRCKGNRNLARRLPMHPKKCTFALSNLHNNII